MSGLYIIGNGPKKLLYSYNYGIAERLNVVIEITVMVQLGYDTVSFPSLF